MSDLIKRINELAHKHKTVGLSEEELTERETLRKRYLDNFRRNFRHQLDQIEFTDEPPKATIKH
ncbi:DUF896 domain-containing protein [Cohnella lubricantis]|uniref:UPF0291 protein H4Q31_20290 n=1 Tax=Cohnella lubricantis TaxID=2163172 RepID=A0A841TGW1_9BACL|nr:DUF896 domain-containing protein [Cohnella lubricantis]MBB6679626.1 DUF896 domain-containing protein [Cohnella lubricantis]MBP2118600.1 uncharacterized protein YnzC (UPF0291/DUF896 family) [Cohnella lubricantis]